MITKHFLKVVLQSLIYLVLVFFLLREVEEKTAIEECTGFDAPPKALERSDYDFLIRHSTFEEPSNRKVVEVVLNPKIEPEEVVSNYCTQREFTARLIDRLNELQASIIALDKIYMRMRCPLDDVGTSKLQDAIRRSRATIVRGVDTEVVPQARINDQKVCLRLRTDPDLSLNVANERSGLLRMDANTKLAPLEWPVHVTDENNNDKIKNLPTLSFVTARAADARTVQTRMLQRAIREHQQPYSTRVDVPVFSAAQILCGSTYTSASDWRTCKSGEQPSELKYAVVIFGDHVGDNDRHQEPQRPQGLYGVDLHANFVAAILDKRCYMPLLSPTGNLIVIGCALLILHVFFHFSKSLLRTFLFALLVWALIVLASFPLAGLTGYLFTVWVHGITFSTILVTVLHHWTTTGTLQQPLVAPK
jgi:CHASE2 domain-containing protein